jgi:hypothetical protein
MALIILHLHLIGDFNLFPHCSYMIAMFRHPIERAASLYYFMRKSPLYVTQLAGLTSIEEYAKSNLVENK